MVPKIILTNNTISNTLSIPSPFKSAAAISSFEGLSIDKMKFIESTISKTLIIPSLLISPKTTGSTDSK